jgi:hypothetical protein
VGGTTELPKSVNPIIFKVQTIFTVKDQEWKRWMEARSG